MCVKCMAQYQAHSRCSRSGGSLRRQENEREQEGERLYNMLLNQCDGVLPLLCSFVIFLPRFWPGHPRTRLGWGLAYPHFHPSSFFPFLFSLSSPLVCSLQRGLILLSLLCLCSRSLKACLNHSGGLGLRSQTQVSVYVLVFLLRHLIVWQIILKRSWETN